MTDKKSATAHPVNTETNTATRLLEGAYALRTAKDNIDYYQDFAAVYDTEFAQGMGYVYPAMLASVYSEHAQKTDVPIIDIGCGTGLVANALMAECNLLPTQMDGIDISPEMLQAASAKSVYCELHCMDLTQGTGDLQKNYGAVLSAGTFTFGHLGPETLPTLLSLGRPGTLYCIGVNSSHFEHQGFGYVLDTMTGNQQITTPSLHQRQIYTSADESHAGDTATVLVYRQR